MTDRLSPEQERDDRAYLRSTIDGSYMACLAVRAYDELEAVRAEKKAWHSLWQLATKRPVNTFIDGPTEDQWAKAWWKAHSEVYGTTASGSLPDLVVIRAALRELNQEGKVPR